jgi:hypothetical protein
MKEQEILKYKQMIDAGLDYLIESIQQKSVIPSNEQDKNVVAVMLAGFKRLIIEVQSVQGLSKLKGWFKNISEWPIEEGDVNYELHIKRQKLVTIQTFLDYYNNELKKSNCPV